MDETFQERAIRGEAASQLRRGSLAGSILGQRLDGEPQPAALLENTIYRLDRIVNIINEGNKSLVDLRSRTFGPWPESGQTTGSVREAAPPTQQARVSDMLDRLEQAARASQENAISLNSCL